MGMHGPSIEFSRFLKSGILNGYAPTDGQIRAAESIDLNDVTVADGFSASGKTDLCALYAAWKLAFSYPYEYDSTLVVCRAFDECRTMVDRIRRFIRLLPEESRPVLTSNSSLELRTASNSVVRLVSSRSASCGRGVSFSSLVVDDMSDWPEGKEGSLLASLVPVLLSDEHSKMLLCSELSLDRKNCLFNRMCIMGVRPFGTQCDSEHVRLNPVGIRNLVRDCK